MPRTTPNQHLVPPGKNDGPRKLALQRVRRNGASITRGIDKALDGSYRSLACITTLNYTLDARKRTTVDTVRCDRAYLLKNLPRQEHLKDIRCAIWREEFGPNGGGPHLHLLTIFGGEHKAPISLSKEIGEFWKNKVTKGRGDYFNDTYKAHQKTPEELKWGHVTGQIGRNDKDKRARLVGYGTGYLGKETQSPPDKGKHDRTMGIRSY